MQECDSSRSLWCAGRQELSLKIKTMKRTNAISGLCALAILLSQAAATEKELACDAFPVALAGDPAGRIFYVAEAARPQIDMVDLDRNQVVGRIDLPEQASGVCLGADAGWLYITTDSPQGKLLGVDLQARKVMFQVAVGHTPMAPVLSPDGKRLYVCNRFTNDISVVDLTARREVGRIPVLREPVAAALTPDGKILAIANHLPRGRADTGDISSHVSLIDTSEQKVIASIPLPNGSTSLRGVCVSPDGRHVYVTHTLGRYQLPTTQLERGWMNTNALSIISLEEKKLLNTVLLDNVDLGAANPWGVACSADGKHLCVAHAGTHEISWIDLPALHKKLQGDAGSASGDLGFLVGMRNRVKLAGVGPRALVLAGGRAVAGEYFSGSLGVVELEEGTAPKVRSILLAPPGPVSAVRRGERLFNDASHCFQQWQSCASCHPDARADGLNWDLLNDGIGNPKNVKSMLLAHKTPPSMSLGIRENAETAVRSGIKYILFAQWPEEDAAAIDAYLKSLTPVPSPYLVNGHLSDAAKRGQRLFNDPKIDCASCHPGPLFTSMQSNDVGTAGPADKPGQAFDIPTLVEAWRTAPYLHDGSAATVHEAILKLKKLGTSNLSEQQLKDLEAYVLSL